MILAPKKKRNVRKKDAEDYVDNKKFANALAEWINENKDNGHRKYWTEMPPYIADCIMKIIQHFSRLGSWRSYSYLDLMQSEATINCIKGIHNFNINISPNAFSYCSEIVRKSFIFILDQEKKQAEIKNEHISRMSIYNYNNIDLHDQEEQI